LSSQFSVPQKRQTATPDSASRSGRGAMHETQVCAATRRKVADRRLVSPRP
jgi:hypothetical protein